ncbi:MAG: hypothetical protein KDE51_21230, partial [Anaerolineales bacterium]|nr:hypothetical protein [Anaerolineales bacterium]
MTTPENKVDQPNKEPQKDQHFEVKQDVGEVKEGGTVIGVSITKNLGPQKNEKIELGEGAVNARDVGNIVTGDGNTINVTNQYGRSAAAERAELLKQANALFDQLPTYQLPPVRPLPSPSRPVYGRNPHFVGRENELRQLAAKLKAGQHMAIAATGLGGIGKSQLAIEFAHRYGQFFAGGVYWVSMAQAETVPTELALCGARLGIDGLEQLPQPQQIELVQKVWETPLPRLLIFDNCEDEALYEQYRPKTGNCRILLTSRKGDWGGTVQPLTLRSLPRADSVALLTTLCPRLTADEAGQLAAELGDFPLALHLAGSYFNRYTRLTASQFVQELQSEQLRHSAMKHHRGVGVNASGHDWNVARTFELSFQQLVAGEGAISDKLLAVSEEPTDTNIQSTTQNQKSEIDLEVDKVALALLARAAHFAPGEPIPVGLLWQTVKEETEDELLLQDGVLRLVELGLLEEGERLDEAQTEPPLQMHRLLAQFVQGVTESEAAQGAV